MWFAIDTLEYLRKGGRIGAAQAWLGSALQIKPILTLEEEITPVERVRTRRRAFERMVEFARERKDAGADAWVVQHIHDPDTARALVDECRQIFGSDPVFVSEIGPVIGAHVGPASAVAISACARLRRSRRIGPEGRARAPRGGDDSRRSAPLAAAEGHQAADGEPDHRGADDQLAAVLAHLAAPVGELGDPAAKRLDRLRELLALALDVGADLGRAAARGRGGAAGDGLAGAAA